jgi:hypothetical protein
MTKKLNLEVDIDQVKNSVIADAEKQIKEYLLRIANEKVHSDYELGIFIRDHIKKWIKDNLKSIVIKELESVDVKSKVEQSVQRAVQDIVHSQIKNIKI